MPIVPIVPKESVCLDVSFKTLYISTQYFVHVIKISHQHTFHSTGLLLLLFLIDEDTLFLISTICFFNNSINVYSHNQLLTILYFHGN